MNKRKLMLHKDISNQKCRKLSFDFGYLDTKIVIQRPAKLTIASLTAPFPIPYLNPRKKLQLNPSSLSNITFSVIMSDQTTVTTKSLLNKKKGKQNSNLNVANDNNPNKNKKDNNECIIIEDVLPNLNQRNEVITLNEEIEKCHLNDNDADANANNAINLIENDSFEEGINGDNNNPIEVKEMGNLVSGGNKANCFEIEGNEVIDSGKPLFNDISKIQVLNNSSLLMSDFSDTMKNLHNNTPIEVIELCSSPMSIDSVNEVHNNNHPNRNENENGIIANNIEDSPIFSDITEEEIDEKVLISQLQSTKPMLIYTYQITNNINILWKDYYSLNPKTYINDIIINFYLRFIEDNINPTTINKVLIMNSYFYSLISKGDKGEMNVILPSFSFQKKYCRADIFANDYIIVPIYDNLHWSLAIIVSPYKIVNLANKNTARSNSKNDYPIILYLDSYFDSNNKCIKICKKYLCCEYARTCNTNSMNDILGLQSKADLIHSFSPMMPRQPNAFDCGIFLLSYSEIFLYNPNFLVNKIILSVPDLEKCFDDKYTKNKRREIQLLIKKLIEKETISVQRYISILQKRIQIINSNSKR